MEPLLPAEVPRGRKRAWPMREVVDAIFHVLRGGIPWRLLPRCFPPWRAVYRWFARLRDAGLRGELEPSPGHARRRAGRT